MGITGLIGPSHYTLVFAWAMFAPGSWVDVAAQALPDEFQCA
jgi:hypothetical protein